MEASEQSALETQLNQVGDAAKAKIKKMASLQDGLLKDTETALECDFKSMRSVMRSLETLAEDQEEEEDENVLHRLQQYQRQYQELQTAYSNAKLETKVDPHEENRRLLLAGADPTRRQRELQSEAEMVGAAQSTTGSLQRSRQVLVEQIDSTQTILASMDASHDQLQKVTTQYQGQADVYGSSRRLLRTLKRHSSWDKLVLYGGAAMFLLVCLYVVQKRSLYFVPTFVKTGLGRLVPTWSRSSSQQADQLVHPIKARGDDSGTDGFRQKPLPETLQNANQAQALLQRHAKKYQAAPELVDAKQAHGTLRADKDHQPVSGKDPSPAQATQHSPPASHGQTTHPKPGADGQAVGTEQAPATNSVTHKQMQDSGYADAFAKIMEGIPDHIKQHPSTNAADSDSDSVPRSDRSHPQPESVLTDDAHSSKVGAAVAAAMDKVAEQQQQQQAVSLDGGAAYPEHVAQVVSGEQTLPHLAALLNNDSMAVNYNVTDSSQSASDQHLQGAMPDNTADLADSIELQDSISSAVQDLLNSTEDTAADKSASLKLHADRPDANSGSSDHTSHDIAESDADVPYQSEADDLASALQSEPRQSVPQEGPASSDDTDFVADQVSDKRFVTQQQMDESGHADAFAKIMESIPDHVKNAASDGTAPADTETPTFDRTDSASSGSGHSSGTQHHQHAEL